MGWLHRRGMISHPVGRAKSVGFTGAGEATAARLFRRRFTKAG